MSANPTCLRCKNNADACTCTAAERILATPAGRAAHDAINSTLKPVEAYEAWLNKHMSEILFGIPMPIGPTVREILQKRNVEMEAVKIAFVSGYGAGVESTTAALREGASIMRNAAANGELPEDVATAIKTIDPRAAGSSTIEA